MTRPAAWRKHHPPRSTTMAPQQSRSATGRAISMHSVSRAATFRAVGTRQQERRSVLALDATSRRPMWATVLNGNQGIEVPGSAPIDSTASVDPNNGTLLFDAGNAAEAVDGGYYDYTASGSEVWNQVVTNPSTDTVPNGGVQASPSLGDAGTLAEAGSLGQVTYGLNTANGSPAPGWPQFDADSNFSTAASADLYNTGSSNFVVGGATSQGFAYGTGYGNGGQVRIYNDHGGLVCAANTTEEVDSSPRSARSWRAAGTGSRPGPEALGDHQRTAGSPTTTRSRCTTPNATRCGVRRLDGYTGGSPALADIQGNGQLAVVEGTATAAGGKRLGDERGDRVRSSGTPTYSALSTAPSRRPTSARATRTSSCRRRTASRSSTAGRAMSGDFDDGTDQRRGAVGQGLRIPERAPRNAGSQRVHRNHCRWLSRRLDGAGTPAYRERSSISNSPARTGAL